MNDTIHYYEDVFNNIDEPILLMEGNLFIYANTAALNSFNMSSKEELLLLHPSQISPKYQEDGELSFVKSNKMIDICIDKNGYSFEWLSKTIDSKTFTID